MVPITAGTVLPARRSPVTLRTADGLNLVGELALPQSRPPVATLVCLHPLPTVGGMMDSHVLRRLPSGCLGWLTWQYCGSTPAARRRGGARATGNSATATPSAVTSRRRLPPASRPACRGCGSWAGRLARNWR